MGPKEKQTIFFFSLFGLFFFFSLLFFLFSIWGKRGGLFKKPPLPKGEKKKKRFIAGFPGLMVFLVTGVKGVFTFLKFRRWGPNFNPREWGVFRKKKTSGFLGEKNPL